MQADTSSMVHNIEIRTFQNSEDAAAFRALNEEWITRHFTLEKKDNETLGDPETFILQKGGHILMVYKDNVAVGCVALIPEGNGVYELSKMAITPDLRGMGIGRQLLEEAIACGRRLGARSLILGSSTKLKNAVHLYESVGFRHIAPETLPPSPYARADVFMELPLGGTTIRT